MFTVDSVKTCKTAELFQVLLERDGLGLDMDRVRWNDIFYGYGNNLTEGNLKNLHGLAHSCHSVI